MNKLIVEKILGVDLRVLTTNGEHHKLSIMDLLGSEDSSLSINSDNDRSPRYKIDIHLECDRFNYGVDIKEVFYERGVMLRNPVNKHFKLITCEEGDWEILEEDGREVASAHSLGNHVWIELLRSLGCTVDEECISNEEMEVRC